MAVMANPRVDDDSTMPFLLIDKEEAPRRWSVRPWKALTADDVRIGDVILDITQPANMLSCLDVDDPEILASGAVKKAWHPAFSGVTEESTAAHLINERFRRWTKKRKNLHAKLRFSVRGEPGRRGRVGMEITTLEPTPYVRRELFNDMDVALHLSRGDGDDDYRPAYLVTGTMVTHGTLRISGDVNAHRHTDNLSDDLITIARSAPQGRLFAFSVARLRWEDDDTLSAVPWCPAYDKGVPGGRSYVYHASLADRLAGVTPHPDEPSPVHPPVGSSTI